MMYNLKYNKKEKKKKKVGRPKMDDSERKSKGYRIRLTKEEFDSLEKMSKITANIFWISERMITGIRHV